MSIADFVRKIYFSSRGTCDSDPTSLRAHVSKITEIAAVLLFLSSFYIEPHNINFVIFKTYP